MTQQSTTMRIFNIFYMFLIFIKSYSCSNSSCLPCSSHLCFQCYNTLPIDRTNVEKLYITCNTTDNTFQQQQQQERYYSIIQSYTMINCPMKTLYLDQYTLWNYLEYMSITYANLTRLSSVIFNHSSSLSSPILYSIKTLNLSYNSIRVINKNFSYYFPSLEKLDLSYNHLVLIKKKSFNNLIYLKELYLNNNYLKQILPNIFPHQSLQLINLNMNYWHCSCTNIHLLSISQPIPNCYTPNEFQNQNVTNIVRQCLLRTNANILITTNIHEKQNLTCALSPIIDEWKNKINKNMTVLSAWHIEQRHSISLEHLFALSNKSTKYLVCFNSKSTYSESIDTIITFSSIVSSLRSSILPINLTKFIQRNSTLISTTILIVTPSNKLPPFFLWIFNTSKNILPKNFQTSDKHVLIVWLILLIIAILILIYLIYFIRYHKKMNKNKSKKSRSFIRFNNNPRSPRTLLNVKFTCKNHKCLCQYRRRAHSTLYLTKSTSLNLLEQQINSIQPLFIEPNQLRYAKIKRITSTKTLDKDYLAGEFRTIVKLKPSPN